MIRQSAWSGKGSFMKTGTAEFEIIIRGRGLSVAREARESYFMVLGLFLNSNI